MENTSSPSESCVRFLNFYPVFSSNKEYSQTCFAPVSAVKRYEFHFGDNAGCLQQQHSIQIRRRAFRISEELDPWPWESEVWQSGFAFDLLNRQQASNLTN